MTYDLEDILADLKAVLVANLNTKLTAITAIKGDSISLPSVDSEAYLLQTLNEKVVQYNPFILYGVSDIRTEGTGPHTLENFVLQIILCHCDLDQDAAMSKRMFRYGRAIKEVLQDNWHMANKIKTRVEALPPAEFKMQNSSDSHRCVGVNLYCAIA